MLLSANQRSPILFFTNNILRHFNSRTYKQVRGSSLGWAPVGFSSVSGPPGKCHLESRLVIQLVRTVQQKWIFVCGHRPKTKKLLELLLLFFSICFISSLKGIKAKKILPSQESNLGPSAHQSSALPTEQQRHCYQSMENYVFNLWISKTMQDLGSVLAQVFVKNYWHVNFLTIVPSSLLSWEQMVCLPWFSGAGFVWTWSMIILSGNSSPVEKGMEENPFRWF